MRRLALLAIATAGLCCTHAGEADLLDAAIRARGGPLARASREVRAEVHVWIPGRWRWEIAHRLPERLRLTVHVTGDEDPHYVFDGETVRGFLGTAPLPVDRETAAVLRSLARFTAVAGLDVLRDADRVAWRELGPGELDPGSDRGLEAHFHDDGALYRLTFDDALRLVEVRGPATLPERGEVPVRVRFEDFRRVEGYRMPFAAGYTSRDRPLLEERVLRFVPDDPALDAEHFESGLHPAHGAP